MRQENTWVSSWEMPSACGMYLEKISTNSKPPMSMRTLERLGVTNNGGRVNDRKS